MLSLLCCVISNDGNILIFAERCGPHVSFRDCISEEMGQRQRVEEEKRWKGLKQVCRYSIDRRVLFFKKASSKHPLTAP